MATAQPEHQVRVQQFLRAAPDPLFNLFSDHEKFGQLLGAPTRRIRDSEEPGNPNGVGSVRRVGPPLLGMEETVLVSDAPRLIEYTVTRGGPIRNHLGRISFEPVDNGTRVTYRIEFDTLIPLTGGPIKFILEHALQRAINKAGRLAE